MNLDEKDLKLFIAHIRREAASFHDTIVLLTPNVCGILYHRRLSMAGVTYVFSLHFVPPPSAPPRHKIHRG